MLHFIVNPKSKSGKGKKIWKDLLPIVKKSSIQYDVYMTEANHHATSLAAQLCKDADDVADAYVVTGGDRSSVRPRKAASDRLYPHRIRQ